MHDLLQAAGVPDSTLKMIPSIIDTCRACRQWKLPTPKSATTSRLITEFNKVVQHDLLKVDGDYFQHLIDAAFRFAQARELSAKDTWSLLRTLWDIWIRPYGPPEELETDQESGLISAESKRYLQRIGTTLKEKGVGSHVKMLERHHDLLRMQYKKLKAACQEEGLNIPKSLIMAEAVLAKNCLFNVGGGTPMQSLFKHAPPLLPPLETTEAMADDAMGSIPGITRNGHRVRELSIGAIIQSTAQMRAEQADRSKTRRSIQGEQYEQGEEVEFFRAPSGKEVSGWHGPGTLVWTEPTGRCSSSGRAALSFVALKTYASQSPFS